MSIISGANAVTGAGAVSYQIERSLRFNSADSAYLSRTPGSTTSSTKATFSFWVKASKTVNGTTNPGTIVGRMSGSYNFVQFWDQNNNGNPVWYFGNTSVWMNTASVVRDYSAWYHVVCILDTTQATDSNRLQIWVNGVRQTAGGFTTYPALNSTQEFLNSSSATYYIGQNGNGGAYLNSYLAEIYFIDGQALDPTSFGEYNSDTGVWQPKAYTGSYGTNGFYLDFSDNSGTTSTTLGKDYSGNGNNWTPNNFSVTAGAGNDSLVDTPTNYGTDTGVGGEVRGNYATWNPLDRTAATYTNGNLEVSSTSSAAPYNMTTTIQLPTSGKWYCEVTALKGANSPLIGIGNNRPTDQIIGYRSNATYISAGVTGVSSSGTPATWTTGDIIGIAYDADAGTLSFYKNGSAQSGGFTSIPATGYCVTVRADSASGDGGTLNAGQRPFAYTAPSGFKALCTQNLPEPTILDGADYMNATLWTGNGATQTITTGLANDLVWTKDRGAAYDHTLFDVLRTPGYFLRSNSTSAEEYRADSLTAFTSTGFSVGADSVRQNINKSGNSYVSWAWKANGTGVTNTAGTITSTVSANTTSGFSIVTYTGNGTNGATVGHGLGVAPKLIIVKRRTTAGASWLVYHASMAATPQNNFLVLNATDAVAASALPWNNTAPTSTVITLGTSGGTNNNTDTFVAYCFAEVAGFSAFGSYTGNGSTDGPFIYLGFRPRYVMWKISSGSTGDWYIVDSVRDTYNVASKTLWPDLSNAEGSGANLIDFVSNGFKIRNSGGSNNGSGYTFIYAAFAENPFKYALAR